MKKKGIGILMCCAAIIGMFALGGLHTEAALCDHTILQVAPDAYKSPAYDSVWHYNVYGMKCSCPRCGYVRWENEYKIRTVPHDFDSNGVCSSCGYKK